MYHAFLSAHHKQYDESAKLTYNRSQSRSANTHGEAEDEERVEQTIDYRTAYHSIYRVLGKALKSHLIVDAERTHDERRAQ